MNLTKKEFFKRKNRKDIYKIYEDVIDRAYDVSEEFANKIRQLKGMKDEHRNNTYIWDILDMVEKDCTRSFEYEAFLRCNTLKKNAYIVSTAVYDTINLDIIKLSNAIGRIKETNNFIEYLKRNELGVRHI